MENNELIRSLRVYGADITGIDSRFMGDCELYEKCFDSMFKDRNLDCLRKAIKEEDYPGAFEAAHALKGLTGNLGLTPLYRAICVLVESLRAKNYLNMNDEYNNIENQLMRLSSISEELHKAKA